MPCKCISQLQALCITVCKFLSWTLIKMCSNLVCCLSFSVHVNSKHKHKSRNKKADMLLYKLQSIVFTSDYYYSSPWKVTKYTLRLWKTPHLIILGDEDNCSYTHV